MAAMKQRSATKLCVTNNKIKIANVRNFGNGFWEQYCCVCIEVSINYEEKPGHKTSFSAQKTEMV